MSMFSMFGFFRLALGILITGLCCRVVLAGNLSKNVGPYVTHFAENVHAKFALSTPNDFRH